MLKSEVKLFIYYILLLSYICMFYEKIYIIENEFDDLLVSKFFFEWEKKDLWDKIKYRFKVFEINILRCFLVK